MRAGARKLNAVTASRAGAGVVRRDGVDGVTMRSVAAAVGVTPMALYRCFDSGTDLRRASVSAALVRVPNPPTEGSPEARLRAWAQTARRRLRNTPGLAAACLMDWPAMSEGCRMMEGLLVVAAAHTENPWEQVAIANEVFVYAVTRAQAEHAVLARRNQRRLPAVEARPRHFPRLAMMQAEYHSIDTDRHFDMGLAALLRGLLVDESAS